MKRKQVFICGLAVVLLLASAGMAFSQETSSGERKNAVTLNLMPLFKGFLAADSDSDTSFFCIAASYERLVAPHYSIGGQIDLYPGKLFDVDYMYFGIAAAARFYPMSENMEKFFLGANLGFNVQSIDGSSKAEDGGFAGLLVGLEAGYRLLLGGLIIEPSMAYVYSKTSELAFMGASVTPLGWQAGLRIGFAF